MVDVEKLEQAVKDFAFYSQPSSSDSHYSATVDDINKLRERTATVLNQFIEELGKLR